VWRERATAATPPPAALVVEVPLLFEAGMEDAFDATIAVVADDDLRTQRTADRGHAAGEEREARQLPQDEKARRATYAVPNDGTPEELEARLSDVLANLSR
jgi:dephospho-CoA kinase